MLGPDVCVGGHEPDPAEAPVTQAAEETANNFNRAPNSHPTHHFRDKPLALRLPQNRRESPAWYPHDLDQCIGEYSCIRPHHPRT